MNAKLNIGKASFVVGLVALALLALTFTSAEAGAPRGAYYSPDGGRILWFMILSDTHIGTSGSADACQPRLGRHDGQGRRRSELHRGHRRPDGLHERELPGAPGRTPSRGME